MFMCGGGNTTAEQGQASHVVFLLIIIIIITSAVTCATGIKIDLKTQHLSTYHRQSTHSKGKNFLIKIYIIHVQPRRIN